MRSRRRVVPQRRRVFVGCEGESERGYAALLVELLDGIRADRHLDIVLLQPGAGDPLQLVERALAHIAADARKRGRGFVRLTYRGQKSSKRHARSHCGHRIPPFARRFGSKDP